MRSPRPRAQAHGVLPPRHGRLGNGRLSAVWVALPFAGLLLLTGLLVLARSPPAQAVCGTVYDVPPPHWRQAYRPPLAIGDSVMLLAVPNLAGEGFEANAHGCRDFKEALTLLRGLSYQGRLPHLVLIALGANGPLTASDVQQALALLGDQRILVLVTARAPGGIASPDTPLIRTLGAQDPTRVRVLDWVADSAGHPAWFQPDGLHLTVPGAIAYGRLLGQALSLAAPPRAVCSGPASTSPTARLDPADPRVLATPGAFIPVAPGKQSIALTITNANPFAVAGTAELHTADRRAPSRLGGLFAAACFAVPPGARQAITLVADQPELNYVSRHGRLAAELVLEVLDPAGSDVPVVESDVLTRGS